MTGMIKPITTNHHKSTRKDQLAEPLERCGAARGTTMRAMSALPSAMGPIPLSEATTSASVAPAHNSPEVLVSEILK